MERIEELECKVDKIRNMLCSMQAEIVETEKEIEEIKEAIGKESEDFPRHCEWCWSLNGFGEIRSYYYNRGNACDFMAARIGNVFPTEEEANFAVERLKVLAEMRKFTFEPDWNNKMQEKIFLRWDGERISVVGSGTHGYGTPCFRDASTARNCIKAIGEERLKKYYFGIKD